MATALPRPVRLAELAPDDRRRILERAAPDTRDVEAAVRGIVDNVAQNGDVALLAYTQQFDGVRPTQPVLQKADFDAALRRLDPTLRRALERAARNLRQVAAAALDQEPLLVEVEPGLVIAERLVPLQRVGCYVPGGQAAYPSSVLMGVVPAKAAGVPDVTVASPPGPNGAPPDAVLAACAIAGADRLLVAGGAQAIAALAYGTASQPAVDKIVGPGNRYVTAAKRLVFGRVGIDSPAGPTEVLILADGSADPEWVARDLVAQAEHGADSRCVLVTTSAPLAAQVADLLPAMAGATARADTVRAALGDHGALLVADDRDEACAFAAAYAPEHLQVMAQEPDTWADRVPTAATTFIGPWAPVPIGDYLTGANHVLPTGGAARWAAQLSVHDFLVRRTRQYADAKAARALMEDLDTLARAEGLPAHAESMMRRRTDPKPLERGR